MNLELKTYNRTAAVEYAHRWAHARNPAYYSFTGIGGDCTNFASQCLYAGAGVMNHTRVFGWYYIDAGRRSASWTGVKYFRNFIVSNRLTGPFGRECRRVELSPGDFIQLAGPEEVYYHTLVVVHTGASPQDLLVAAHTDDSDYRPLSTYRYRSARFLKIEGVRRLAGV